MVLIEAVEASGNVPVFAGSEIASQSYSAREEGLVIEFPRFDPMKLTRDEWLGISDSRSKTDALVALRKMSHKPEYVEKTRELFPEGYSVPLSEIEKRVFGAMIHVMKTDDEVSLWDKQILEEHLHDISADDAIEVLKQEADRRATADDFWYSRNDLGGYELNRLIAKEIEDTVITDQKRDEIRMHALQEMSLTLEGFGIPMLKQDQVELDKLRAEYEEREEARRAYWQAEREKGYQATKLP